jgi:hypothetical protein
MDFGIETMSIVIAAIGGLTGIGSLVIAARANRIAQQSREDARRANQIALDANIISAEANGIAVNANKFAEEANTIARLQDARTSERNDVVWDGNWPEPGRYVLTNNGQDEAIRVHTVVAVDGNEKQAVSDHIGPGESLIFAFEAAANQIDNKVKQRRRENAERPFGLATNGLHYLEFGVGVSYRVTWVTHLGTPHVDKSKVIISDLGVDTSMPAHRATSKIDPNEAATDPKLMMPNFVCELGLLSFCERFRDSRDIDIA